MPPFGVGIGIRVAVGFAVGTGPYADGDSEP